MDVLNVTKEVDDDQIKAIIESDRHVTVREIVKNTKINNRPSYTTSWTS